MFANLIRKLSQLGNSRMCPVRRVCAWCSREMGIAMWDVPKSEPAPEATHGMCEECAKKE